MQLMVVASEIYTWRERRPNRYCTFIHGGWSAVRQSLYQVPRGVVVGFIQY